MELEKRHWIGIGAGVLVLIGLVLIVINLGGSGREKLEAPAEPEAAPSAAGRTAPGYRGEE